LEAGGQHKGLKRLGTTSTRGARLGKVERKKFSGEAPKADWPPRGRKRKYEVAQTLSPGEM